MRLLRARCILAEYNCSGCSLTLKDPDLAFKADKKGEVHVLKVEGFWFDLDWRYLLGMQLANVCIQRLEKIKGTNWNFAVDRVFNEQIERCSR